MIIKAKPEHITNDYKFMVGDRVRSNGRNDVLMANVETAKITAIVEINDVVYFILEIIQSDYVAGVSEIFPTSHLSSLPPTGQH